MNIGITLMLVGMVTVFSALLIIIFLSNMLICLVNKFAPEEEAKHKTAPSNAPIPQDIMEVIRQTVNQVTAGKGTVSNVEKL